MKKRPNVARKRNATERGLDMRSAIKRVATLLFTRFGFRGVSFADIALELGITTTNIHYHFGSKLDLVEELLIEQANVVAERYGTIWREPTTGLGKKIERVLTFNQEVYDLHNKPGDDGHPWGLLVRLSADGDALSDRARKRIASLRREIDDSVQAGVKIAVGSGELSDTIPQREVARLFTSLLLYGPFITRDAGGIQGLRVAHHTLLDLVTRAYPSQRREQAGRIKATSKLRTSRV
jgi:TetR/AcrR family transcriptional regulator, transcriptional repressor for nem operon